MTVSQSISGHTKTTCLIGKPTDHSMSPALHNFSYSNLGVDAVYTTFDVEPENLEAVIAGMKGMDKMAGCNVTMPHKRNVIPFLDEISPAAELVNAVNVVAFRDGKAYGYNSDGQGFMENLKAHGVTLEGAVMTLIGPGGAGSAIFAQGALDGMKKIHLFARAGGNSYNAVSSMIPLVEEKTGCVVLLHDLADEVALKEALDESDILANATNIGMGDKEGECPIPAELIRPGLVVADAIYHPRETALLARAKALGNKAINGLGMLLYQAAIGEKEWFGVDMDIAAVEEAIFSE